LRYGIIIFYHLPEFQGQALTFLITAVKPGVNDHLRSRWHELVRPWKTFSHIPQRIEDVRTQTVELAIPPWWNLFGKNHKIRTNHNRETDDGS
jgi:hypothetical protein